MSKRLENEGAEIAEVEDIALQDESAENITGGQTLHEFDVNGGVRAVGLAKKEHAVRG